jgi:DnaJ homolog subfamily A member 2
VPDDQREEAAIKFKAANQAYEILYDDEKRALYDQHGMSAFDPSSRNGMGADVDLDDILSSMFGMGMGGGMPGFGAGQGGRPRKPRKGQNEDQEYKVSLEDLYKGKTVKFASTKNVICSLCKGTGGKEKAKPKQCANCGGQGRITILVCWSLLTSLDRIQTDY